MTLVVATLTADYIILAADGLAMSKGKIADTRYQKLYELDYNLFFGFAGNDVEYTEVSEFVAFCRRSINHLFKYSMDTIASQFSDLAKQYFTDRESDFFLQFILGGFGSNDEPKLYTLQHNDGYKVHGQLIDKIITAGKTNVPLPVKQKDMPSKQAELAEMLKLIILSGTNLFPDEIGGMGRITIIRKDGHVQETFTELSPIPRKERYDTITDTY